MSNLRRSVTLRQRPKGLPLVEDFQLQEEVIPAPGPGEVLTRTLWLSLDPYMRGRMSDAKSYAAPVQIGEPITAEAVGEVVASNNPEIPVGDMGPVFAGWQDYAVSDGKGTRRVDPESAPPSTALGVLGMPG